MGNILLSGKDICKEYRGEISKEVILNHLNIDIFEGDFTIIMGSSGAGKSTLLYALSGMAPVSSGEVVYKTQVISKLKEKQMAKLRAMEFGFVFQQTHLVSNLTLYENVKVAGLLNKNRNKDEVERRAEELLTQMHVEKARDRMPASTSGGEAQRAAIARAVINQPGILFADEPTGALNKANTEEVLNLFTTLNEEGQSILMVTHDIRAAMRGNRIIYLEDGRIVDELVLPKYEKDTGRKRETQINKWLEDLEW